MATYFWWGTAGDGLFSNADNWGLKHLTKRVEETTNYSHVFDFAQKPRDPDPQRLKPDCLGTIRKTFNDKKEWPPPFGTAAS